MLEIKGAYHYPRQNFTRNSWRHLLLWHITNYTTRLLHNSLCKLHKQKSWLCIYAKASILKQISQFLTYLDRAEEWFSHCKDQIRSTDLKAALCWILQRWVVPGDHKAYFALITYIAMVLSLFQSCPAYYQLGFCFVFSIEAFHLLLQLSSLCRHQQNCLSKLQECARSLNTPGNPAVCFHRHEIVD